MPRKMDINKMQLKLARLNERTKDAESALKNLEESRNKLQQKIKEEERKIRTHNLCNIGGMVYKYFGENLTSEEFKDILDFLFSNTEIQEYVNSEKEKRFIRDNPPVVINPTSETELSDNGGTKIISTALASESKNT